MQESNLPPNHSFMDTGEDDRDLPPDLEEEEWFDEPEVEWNEDEDLLDE